MTFCRQIVPQNRIDWKGSVDDGYDKAISRDANGHRHQTTGEIRR